MRVDEAQAHASEARAGGQGSFTKLNSEQTIPLTNSAGEIIGETKSEFFGVSDTSYNTWRCRSMPST